MMNNQRMDEIVKKADWLKDFMYCLHFFQYFEEMVSSCTYVCMYVWDSLAVLYLVDIQKRFQHHP